MSRRRRLWRSRTPSCIRFCPPRPRNFGPSSTASATPRLLPHKCSHLWSRTTSAPTRRQGWGYAMPGVSDTLAGLPRTYIFNAEFDGLRASGERFAYPLAHAGVPVALHPVADVGHGHLARPGLVRSRQSHRDLAAWVRDRHAPPGTQLESRRLPRR
ncbi:alpha/beta hydrolase [Nocardia africana]